MKKIHKTVSKDYLENAIDMLVCYPTFHYLRNYNEMLNYLQAGKNLMLEFSNKHCLNKLVFSLYYLEYEIYLINENY